MNEQLMKMIKQLGLKPEEAAKKLGIGTDVLNQIEKGIKKIDAKDLEKYAKKLGIDPSKLDLKDVAKNIGKIDADDLGKLAKGFLKK